MRNAKLITGAAAGAALLVAAGAAAAPRVWRRLRRGSTDEEVFTDTFESDYPGPPADGLGDPETPVDEEANAALREELRAKVSDLGAQSVEPVAPVAVPVEPDLIVEGVPGADPAADAARARLRPKAADATESFRS